MVGGVMKQVDSPERIIYKPLDDIGSWTTMIERVPLAWSSTSKIIVTLIGVVKEGVLNPQCETGIRIRGETGGGEIEPVHGRDIAADVLHNV
jgi:hypothetical protein